MAEAIDHVFARSMEDLRKARGWTGKQLADVARISPSSISDMEHGRRGCSLRTAHAIATALETTVDAMIAAVSRG